MSAFILYRKDDPRKRLGFATREGADRALAASSAADYDVKPRAEFARMIAPPYLPHEVIDEDMIAWLDVYASEDADVLREAEIADIKHDIALLKKHRKTGFKILDMNPEPE